MAVLAGLTADFDHVHYSWPLLTQHPPQLHPGSQGHADSPVNMAQQQQLQSRHEYQQVQMVSQQHQQQMTTEQ